MRIFYSFLIMFGAVLLAILPMTGAQYALLTDLREDNFTVTTDNATTTGTVQLVKDIYDDDVTTITLSSDDVDDSPLYSSYNATSRALIVSGLAVSTARTLTVGYDVDAINSSAFSSALTVGGYPWLIMIVLFPLGGLIWLWAGPVKRKLTGE